MHLCFKDKDKGISRHDRHTPVCWQKSLVLDYEYQKHAIKQVGKESGAGQAGTQIYAGLPAPGPGTAMTR